MATSNYLFKKPASLINKKTEFLDQIQIYKTSARQIPTNICNSQDEYME